MQSINEREDDTAETFLQLKAIVESRCLFISRVYLMGYKALKGLGLCFVVTRHH